MSSEPFTELIPRLMAERKVTFRRLAEGTGLSAGYLCKTVTGQQPVPRNEILERIAKLLGTPADSIREYRLRRISELLGQDPRRLDDLYRRLSKPAAKPGRTGSGRRR